MTRDWIALDWTTTRRRLWVMRGRDVLDETVDDGPRPADPAATLALVAGRHQGQGVPVVACGPLGPVRAPIPCTPLAGGLWRIDLGDPRIAFHAVAGLRQELPADMMQGDETRIAGFLALNPGWDGVICLTGETSRWVHVSAGEVVSFRSFLSGALVSALGAGTMLGRWLATPELDRATFSEAVADGLSRPEQVLARLWSAHAAATLDGLPPEMARARILGTLIGAELAATRPFWLGQQLAVMGEGVMPRLHVDALAAQGAPAIEADAPRMTREGLIAAWTALAA
ncbi:2-dehydro-3-deoxygalactonokinase [Ruegeria marina]|uniref:2-keto-3-deoxygalactonate kinase n=1 Tax=Ruegeria marina TaxID=639004 RepID=A0A1G6LI53_9RHOB|nr:2-dehydro-3-deoxygalactonokinase [Ruegeria marina]SDC42958.1 2-keto-3-deoxygalactonate kinase [Ruegeria marina]